MDFLKEINGIILETKFWNRAKGLIPNLGKIKNIITKINNVNIIGRMNLEFPCSFLDINKLNIK